MLPGTGEVGEMASYHAGQPAPLTGMGRCGLVESYPFFTDRANLAIVSVGVNIDL
jgi:hypothetical protein